MLYTYYYHSRSFDPNGGKREKEKEKGEVRKKERKKERERERMREGRETMDANTMEYGIVEGAICSMKSNITLIKLSES